MLKTEMSKEKMKLTKEKMLVAAIAFLIVSVIVMALYLENLGNRANPAKVIRVACIGDSITEGTEYPAYLRALLGSGYMVGNYGVGGSTVLLSSDKPYMNQTSFRRAKEFLPDVVVIMLGTNDATPNVYRNIDGFVDDYKKMVGEFQALASQPEIWIVKPPPIFNDNLGPSNENLMQGVIPRVDQVANELGLPIIDVYSVMRDHPEYFVDGVHPNSEGARVVASEISKAISFVGV
jgi:acyl-CoA thioesterase-1